MSARQFFTWLLQSCSSLLDTAGADQLRPQHRFSPRPHLEQLEGRIVPSTFTLNVKDLSGQPNMYVVGFTTVSKKCLDLDAQGNGIFVDTGGRAQLPEFKIGTGAGQFKGTITLNDTPLDSVNLYFLNAPFVFKCSNGGANVVQPSPFDNNNPVFESVEFTWHLNTSGMDSIDFTQVTQFGMPLQMTGPAGFGSVGVDSRVFRPDLFTQFRQAFPAGDIYHNLVWQSGSGFDLRLLNPAKLLSLYRGQPTVEAGLRTVFDDTLKKLFEQDGTISLTIGSDHFTGTRNTLASVGGHTYHVIRFTGASLPQPVDVYEPFFSTNGHAGYPPPPSWFGQTDESSGEMVFGNDGVFNNPQDDTSGHLVDIQNRIVTALNRGMIDPAANSPNNTTAKWETFADFYTSTTVPYNRYAKFLHELKINGISYFIDGRVYGFGYDESVPGYQGPPKFDNIPSGNTVTITLGRWTPPAAPAPSAFTPLRVNQRTPVTFTGSFKATAGPYTVTINWGDKTPLTTVSTKVPSFKAPHAYALPGTYTVIVTVSDKTGQTASKAFQVVVVKTGQANPTPRVLAQTAPLGGTTLSTPDDLASLGAFIATLDTDPTPGRRSSGKPPR